MVALWAVLMPGRSSLSQRGRIRARVIASGEHVQLSVRARSVGVGIL